MAERDQISASERERNLELLRRGTEAYNSGDLSFVVELAADDIEVHADAGLVNSGTWQGRDEFQRWMLNWQEAWSEITLDVRNVETAEDRFLLVDVGQRATGAASGIPVEMDIVQLIEAGGGEIKRFHLYTDREQALAALERLRGEGDAA
jgi:ketosteroid isomerase-like protein